MGFEKRVLNDVAEVLQNSHSASFTCGTLFVACTEREARSVYHRLTRDFGLGTIQINGPIQGEYAFDFVAEKQQEDLSPFATVNS